jgi:hypothetical protein
MISRTGLAIELHRVCCMYQPMKRITAYKWNETDMYIKLLSGKVWQSAVG